MKKRYRHYKLKQRLPFRVKIQRLLTLIGRVVLFSSLVIVVALATKRMVDFVHSPFFNVGQVTIEGADQELTEKVSRKFDLLLDENHNNFLFISKGELAEVLASVPEIKSFSIEKHPPHTLLISVCQRQPAAIVLTGQLLLVDHEGFVFKRLSSRQFKHYRLPLLSGLKTHPVPGVRLTHPKAKGALAFLEALKSHNYSFYTQIAELNLATPREIKVLLNQGTKILFTEHTILERLPELDAFYQKYLRDPQKYQYVDFRFQNQIAYARR